LVLIILTRTSAYNWRWPFI